MNRTLPFVFWAFLGALAAAVAYYSLGLYDHNDHMYAVAPVLLQRGRLYADFGFVQTPLSALLFAAIFKLTGAIPFYDALRIFSLALNLAIVGLGIFFCRRHARHKDFAGFVFAGLYLWFADTGMIGAEIGNYTLALILAVLALVCLDVWRDRVWCAFAVGLFAGLSLSAKMSSIFLLIAFAFVRLMPSGPSLTLRAFVARNGPLDRFVSPAGKSLPNPRGVRKTALFALGALLGVLPILYYLAANPALFLFENVHFHYLSNIYRGIAPIGAGASLAFFSIGSGSFALILLLVAGAASWGAWKLAQRFLPRLRNFAPTRFEQDVLIFAVAAIVGAVTPGVVFQQYFAAPAFAIFLLLALALDRTAQPWRIAGIAIIFALGAWRIADLVPQARARQADGTYAMTAVPAARAKLARAIAAIDRAHPGCHGDLVTSFGVPAIGAGARLSPIASNGSFAMRLDYIFVDNAPDYRWLSDVTRYLNPRSLILSGFYYDTSDEPRSDFEPAMNAYAAEHHFARLPLGLFMHRPVFLYAPAACAI